MQQYKELLQRVLSEGEIKTDRTGTGTISAFGHQMRFDLSKGFPLLTTKKLHTKSIFHELLWFLDGDTNIKYLHDNGVKIWDEWIMPDNTIGKGYGYQWRSWVDNNGNVIDQITNVINQIKTNPDSRRLIVSAWNVGDLDSMALPPCHLLFQFYVSKNKLSCQLYQRSGDIFLGVPFNIASYALLTSMVAQVCDLEVGEFIHTIGDAHIYTNHIDQCKLQLTRECRELPKLVLNNKIGNIFDFKYDDIKIENYDPHPHIKGDVAI